MLADGVTGGEERSPILVDDDWSALSPESVEAKEASADEGSASPGNNHHDPGVRAVPPARRRRVADDAMSPAAMLKALE
jgi:hypothetical protein